MILRLQGKDNIWENSSLFKGKNVKIDTNKEIERLKPLSNHHFYPKEIFLKVLRRLEKAEVYYPRLKKAYTNLAKSLRKLIHCHITRR